MIRRRLETARQELLLAPAYDYIVIANEPEQTAGEIRAILENDTDTVCTPERKESDFT